MGDSTAERCYRHATIRGISAERCVIPYEFVQTRREKKRIQGRPKESVLARAYGELTCTDEEGRLKPSQLRCSAQQTMQMFKSSRLDGMECGRT